VKAAVDREKAAKKGDNQFLDFLIGYDVPTLYNDSQYAGSGTRK